MSDLENFVSMLDRCKIQHCDYEHEGVTEISLSPDNLDYERYENDPPRSPNLTGDHWAGVDFNFSVDGQLIGVKISGD